MRLADCTCTWELLEGLQNNPSKESEAQIFFPVIEYCLINMQHFSPS